MDQKKIGQFIGQRRKEREMTQKQLADEIGVSDKTVSKWETGNGLPDITLLNVLCQALEINVNELLSGEKLPPETYSEKAEENIMNLWEENQSTKKTARIQWIEGGILLFLGVFLTVTTSVGLFGWTIFLPRILDLPSLLLVTILTVALALLSGPRNKREWIKVVRKNLLPVGLFLTMMGFCVISIYMDFDDPTWQWLLLTNLMIAAIPLVYALIAYMLFGVAEERMSHSEV
ncbi:MAG: helix-turn-helix domain-containing protein [Lachnospiraceae bacterium]|nr:helix-turn-helix domain-containing protein [Lachnospiraceae bacterium]